MIAVRLVHIGIGLMGATFHNKGNSCFEIHVFIMCVRGDAKCSVTSLINLVGILSGPVEQ